MAEQSAAQPVEEFRLHLAQAEEHMRQALDLLHGPEDPKRSIRCQQLLNRARDIVSAIHAQETRRKERSEPI